MAVQRSSGEIIKMVAWLVRCGRGGFRPDSLRPHHLARRLNRLGAILRFLAIGDGAVVVMMSRLQRRRPAAVSETPKIPNNSMPLVEPSAAPFGA